MPSYRVSLFIWHLPGQFQDAVRIQLRFRPSTVGAAAVQDACRSLETQGYFRIR